MFIDLYGIRSYFYFFVFVWVNQSETGRMCSLIISPQREKEKKNLFGFVIVCS